MEKFLLLIREDMEKLKVLPAEDFQDCMDRMKLWVEKLAENGNYVAAEPLRTIGRYVSKENVLSDGPFIEAKEAISGYFIISAQNLEQAAEIAQTCPQVVNGNSVIEVRQIKAMDNE